MCGPVLDQLGTIWAGEYLLLLLFQSFLRELQFTVKFFPTITVDKSL